MPLAVSVKTETAGWGLACRSFSLSGRGHWPTRHGAATERAACVAFNCRTVRLITRRCDFGVQGTVANRGGGQEPAATGAYAGLPFFLGESSTPILKTRVRPFIQEGRAGERVQQGCDTGSGWTVAQWDEVSASSKGWCFAIKQLINNCLYPVRIVGCVIRWGDRLR